MKLCTAFDLHSSSSYLAILDEQEQRIHKEKLANDPELIIGSLKPYKGQIVGVLVEAMARPHRIEYEGAV